MEAEFGMPQWIFGMSSYAFSSETEIVCCYIERGISHLATIDTRSGELSPIESEYTDIQYLRAHGGQVVFRGGSPTAPVAIVQLDLSSRSFHIVRSSMKVDLDEEYISPPEA